MTIPVYYYEWGRVSNLRYLKSKLGVIPSIKSDIDNRSRKHRAKYRHAFNAD